LVWIYYTSFAPYHPELNPIAKIWSMFKNWMVIIFQLYDIGKLAEEKFSSITKEEWLSVCKDVQNWKRNMYKMNTWSTALLRNL
jgi:hypothetical protein